MNTRTSEGTTSSQRICKEVAESKLILRSDCGDWSASHDGLGSSAYQGISTEQGETLALVVAHTSSLWREPNLDHGRCLVDRWNQHAELLAQRDELAKALKDLMELESRSRFMPIGKEWDAARAAIEKVKP